MRLSIIRKIREDRGAIVGWEKGMLYLAVTLLLLLFQKAAGIAAGEIADKFSYERIDPYNAYAWNFVHHITMFLIALSAILILCKLFKINFGFGLGDIKTGTKFVVIYTAVFAGITLAVHILMKRNNSLPVYAFPLNTNNIIGTLCFSLLLSGPAEETLFRALPVTILEKISGKKTVIKWGITIESIIASFLFAIAHMKWSLFPVTVEMDYSSFSYAFLQGIISGKAYQDSGSIIYPMFMHSISNVMMVGTGYLFLLL